MLETGDNELVEVMIRCSAVHYASDAVGRSLCHLGRTVQRFSFAVGPPIHIGEVWLILPTKRNSRLLTLQERPRAGRCQWTNQPGAVLLPGPRCWLCLALYLGCREGDVGAFWLVILLAQVVGAADSFDALSLSSGHMSVDAGFMLLDTAVGVVMECCLCEMNTTHGLRRLHRCFAAVHAAFAVVDHVVVADDAELAAAAAYV